MKILKRAWQYSLIFLVLFLSASNLTISGIRYIAQAENSKQQEISEEEIEKEVISQIEDIDFAKIEEFCENELDVDIFNNKTLPELIKEMVISGKTIGFSEMLLLVFGGVSGSIDKVLKLVALIVAVVGFGSFSGLLESFSKKGSGISSVVNFFILTIILSLVASIIADFVGETTSLLNKMKTLMEIIFPLLLSLLVTVGGTTSSSILQPAVIVLTGGVIELVVFLTTTATTIYLVLAVLGELTDAVKLGGLKNFISSAYKWTLGLIFTIFMGYLSLSGITAGGADRISIKTAKYAIKSYIPLVGGYVSDSYEIFRVGTVLIKNSIGVIGVLILFSLVVGKVVNLIIYNLGFKLASGLSEPISAGKTSRFLSSLSTIFNFLIAGIVACFLLGCLTLLVVMSSANIV